MQTLSPFYPAIVVFIGAVLVAGGGFWASYRQSNFNAQIQAKNAEIAELQKEISYSVTGGDSYAEMILGVQGTTGHPTFVHHGRYPLYNVTVRIVDLDPSKPKTVQSLVGVTIPVGDLIPGHAKPASFSAEAAPDGSFSYNVFFTARNGSWTEELRMRKTEGGYARAMVIRATAMQAARGELLRRISSDYTVGPNGEIDFEKHPKP